MSVATVATPKLTLETALRIIPKFDGSDGSSLSAYESQCEFILNNLSDENKPIIVQALLSQIVGKAMMLLNIEL